MLFGFSTANSTAKLLQLNQRVNESINLGLSSPNVLAIKLASPSFSLFNKQSLTT